MMEATLRQDSEIQELLQILRIFKREKEAGEVFELVTYMDGLENKLGQIMDELINVKKQLVEIKELNEKKFLKKVLSDAVEKLEENCKQMKESLKEIKNEVKEKSGKIIEAVKEKGRKGLNKLSEFFGVKEKLIRLKTCADQSIKEIDGTIARIDNFEQEMHETKVHMSYAIKAIQGKVQDSVEKAKPKSVSLIEVLKTPWKVKRKIFMSILERTNAAINKVDSLSENYTKERGSELLNMEKINAIKVEDEETVRTNNSDIQPVDYYEKEVRNFIDTTAADGVTYGSNSQAFEDFVKQLSKSCKDDECTEKKLYFQVK